MPIITKESNGDFTIKSMSHCLCQFSFSFESFIRQTRSSTPFRGVKGNKSYWFRNKPVSVSKYRPSAARRLVAYFHLIVCDATARAVTFVVGSSVVSPWSHRAEEGHRENTP